jgi:23S rRNA (uracil1939-C5)-methyltransferase
VKTCIHFGICGGCSFQNMTPEDYRAMKRDVVVMALTRAGLGDVHVNPPLEVPDFSRRRAVFKLRKMEGGLEVGFHAAKSHAIVDMHECLVLTPALFNLTQTLRSALAPILNNGETAEVHATEADNGIDLGLRWARKLTPSLTGDLAKAFSGKGIVRISVNNEVVREDAKPMVKLAGAEVALPPLAFLQATREGEKALQDHVMTLAKGAKNIADLFAGLGTFSLALARGVKVHAVEQDAVALAALAAAARTTSGLKPITTERRDLFKQPLSAAELKVFDMLVLDPPRAGAEAQIREAAGSALRRIAYVSCDAGSFARDAAILIKAGFKPGPVTPIDQFRYSGHIELVGSFERGKVK